MSKETANAEIEVCKNEVFLLPTRVVAWDKDYEEDLSDVSSEEDVVEEGDMKEILRQHDMQSKGINEKGPPMLEILEGCTDHYGLDVDGRDISDDTLPSLQEASCFSPYTLCGEAHEVEHVVLWDYFGGNNYDDLNVHAGDIVCVVAEEYQVRVVEDHEYLRLPFQWSLGRWITDRPVNPYLGLIPSHYIVSKQFYDDHPLLFKWPVWFHGNAEIHGVVHNLYSDRSALCPGLFAIFSPDWLNIDLDEHRCYLLMILTERGKKHDNQLRRLIEIERGNYGIMTDSINHVVGEMIQEHNRKEKTAQQRNIEFLSEIETTPFEPAVVTIHRSSLGHYELMGERYDTLYDLVHYLSTHRSALPHKLVYCRSSPLVVGRNVVPPPTRKFKKDICSQPMIIEQWAATHFDGVTRRLESSEKTMFVTKTIFDIEKKHHEKLAKRLKLTPEEIGRASAYLKTFEMPQSKKQKKPDKQWDSPEMPPHETAIRINSPFYVESNKINLTRVSFGKGAFGEVLKGSVTKCSGETVTMAVKKLFLKDTSKDSRNTAFTEMEILEMVAHPNVVFYYGFSMSNSTLYLLFEIMDCDSLDKFILKCDAVLSENEKLDLLVQITRGMSYLHTRTPPVVHGDLAARNVLLKKHPVYNKKYIAKITDLGLAKTCRDELYTKYDDPHKIPFKWLPPEVLSSRTLSLKVDVWAFGIMCFEVCTVMAEPYGVLSSNLYQFLNDGYRHEIVNNMSPKIYAITLDCMKKNPVDRPHFEELTDRFVDCIVENDGEDEVIRKQREKVLADKARKERMHKAHEKLVKE